MCEGGACEGEGVCVCGFSADLIIERNGKC